MIHKDENGLPLNPSDAFKMSFVVHDNLFQALNTLQSIDDQALNDYLMTWGVPDINALLRDLVYFEAKTNKDFMRGLCVGIASTLTDYEKLQANGEGVIPTLRAGLALLRNTMTDVITGRELILKKEDD